MPKAKGGKFVSVLATHGVECTVRSMMSPVDVENFASLASGERRVTRKIMRGS